MSLPQLEPGLAHKALLSGPDTEIEYRLETPPDALRGLCLICHPHPLYGGTMDNKVVYALSRAAMAQGCAALRFNFRGVGASGGEHDEGRGELEDARFLAEALQGLAPDLPLILSGFSFGSYVALSLAAQRQAQALITIAPPLRYAAEATVPEPLCPWLLVHGDADDVVDCEDTLKRAQAMSKQPDSHILSGAGHFFHGQLGELRQIVEPWIESHLAR